MQLNIPVPVNLIEFEKTYRRDSHCRRALFRARWPEGFVCPKCSGRKCWQRKARPGVIECASCHLETTVTAGTLFHGAKLPLSLAFRIVYMIVMEKTGISAMALHRQLGVNYKTAELWLRKVRTAMVRPGRENLSGRVEVDESMLGGEAPGYKGRKRGPHQAWMVIYAEDKGKQGFGRIRLVHTPKVDSEWLGDSVRTEVDKGSTLHTDGLQAYRHLANEGYQHEREVIPSPKQASKLFPKVHRVAALVKRWIMGTFQGSWSPQWLQSFLDEYVFRFNRRNSARRPLLFIRVLETGITRRAPTRAAFAAYAQEHAGGSW